MKRGIRATGFAGAAHAVRFALPCLAACATPQPGGTRSAPAPPPTTGAADSARPSPVAPRPEPPRAPLKLGDEDLRGFAPAPPPSPSPTPSSTANSVDGVPAAADEPPIDAAREEARLREEILRAEADVRALREEARATRDRAEALREDAMDLLDRAETLELDSRTEYFSGFVASPGAGVMRAEAASLRRRGGDLYAESERRAAEAGRLNRRVKERQDEHARLVGRLAQLRREARPRP